MIFILLWLASGALAAEMIRRNLNANYSINHDTWLNELYPWFTTLMGPIALVPLLLDKYAFRD